MQDSSGPCPSIPQESNQMRKFSRSNWWYLLLLIPLAGLIYPALYSRMYPTLGGVPFFIWYQFAWIFGGIATTLTVSHLTE
jgi:uncharacterized membrane protein YhaH (DUF805 family)